MMGKTTGLVCGAVAAGLWAGAATAQGFKGAELSAEILAFTEDTDLGETTYEGSVEFGVFGGFSVAADLSYHGFRSLGTDASVPRLRKPW